MSVSKRLANCNDIRDHIMKLKSPETFAYSATPNLNFICDANSPFFPNSIKCFFQKALGQLNLSPATYNRLNDDAADTSSFTFNPLDELGDLAYILIATSLSLVLAPELVRQRKHMSSIRGASPSFAIKFVR